MKPIKEQLLKDKRYEVGNIVTILPNIGDYSHNYFATSRDDQGGLMDKYAGLKCCISKCDGRNDYRLCLVDENKEVNKYAHYINRWLWSWDMFVESYSYSLMSKIDAFFIQKETPWKQHDVERYASGGDVFYKHLFKIDHVVTIRKDIASLKYPSSLTDLTHQRLDQFAGKKAVISHVYNAGKYVDVKIPSIKTDDKWLVYLPIWFLEESRNLTYAPTDKYKLIDKINAEMKGV